MTVLIFILLISVLIIVHELGHYLVARWSGVKVEEFGLGYPPRALKLFRWKGTDFTLNWIFFGGFVKLAGEEELLAELDKDDDEVRSDDKAENNDKVKSSAKSSSIKSSAKAKASKNATKSQSPRKFYEVSTLRKLAVILAGAFFNIVFGFVVFSLIFSFQGIPEPLEEARIGQVAPDSPAEQAQVPEQVRIMGFLVDEEGEETLALTPNPQEVVELVTAYEGQEVTLVTTGPCVGLECQESAHFYPLTLRTHEETPPGQGLLGVAFEPFAFVFYPAWEMPFRGIGFGLEQTVFLSEQIILALGQLGRDAFRSGQVSPDIAGPVGIVHMAQSAGLVQAGAGAVLSFAAMLSINLAIINLMPIPPLDGGRAVFIVLQGFIKGKTLRRIEANLNYTGYLLLLILIVLITIRDIGRIFQ